MKTVWIGNNVNRNVKLSLRAFAHYLLVDVIPIILLLAAMAYGMAFVSYKMTELHSVELSVFAEKQS